MKKNSFFWGVIVLLGVLQGCSEQKPAVTIASACALDGIVGAGKMAGENYVSLPNAKLRVIGWIADVNSAQTPREISIVLLGANGTATTIGKGSAEPRPDVAAAFNKPAIANSGYSVSLELGKSVPNGIYDVILNGVFDGKVGVCDTNKKIKIGS